MAKATPLREALRNRLRDVRRDLGLTQEEFAMWVQVKSGLAWDRSTVRHVEDGSRDVSLGEFFPLVYLLQLEELFPPDVALELDDGRRIQGGRQLRALLEPRQDATARPGTIRLGVAVESAQAQPITPKLDSDRPTLADGKAAEALQTSVSNIQKASQRLWGHGLATERDRRVQARLEGREVSARSLQAIRGHVTRELLDEIRPEIQRSKTTKRRRSE